jgi:hypothetical protein
MKFMPVLRRILIATLLSAANSSSAGLLFESGSDLLALCKPYEGVINKTSKWEDWSRTDKISAEQCGKRIAELLVEMAVPVCHGERQKVPPTCCINTYTDVPMIGIGFLLSDYKIKRGISGVNEWLPSRYAIKEAFSFLFPSCSALK